MSNLDPRPDAVELRASVVRAVDVVEARKAAVGDGTEVRRLLPGRELRTVGAWCFLDHYGPDDVSAGPGMHVPPHPHTGLQTVSWLFEGLVLHRDSLGSEQVVRPGELNLMTSGRAIAHSEESPAARPARLHGLQLWIALPEERRHGDPGFAHHAGLPVLTETGGARVTVVGRVRGRALAGPVLHAARRARGRPSRSGPGHPAGRRRLRVRGDPGGRARQRRLPGRRGQPGGGKRGDARAPASRDAVNHAVVGRPRPVFVVGGVPLGEKLVMWWNFVGRSHEEIVTARNAWDRGEWGEVRGYARNRLPAPPLPPGKLKPR